MNYFNLILSCWKHSHRLMKIAFVVSSFFAFVGAAPAQALDWNGKIRALWHQSDSKQSSPAFLSDLAMPLRMQTETVESELDVKTAYFTTRATLQGQHSSQSDAKLKGWFNEFFVSSGDGDWQLTIGKKILDWDVAYAFRPNDMVQQEQRRKLTQTSAIGKNMLLLDYFDAKLAASICLVEPWKSITDEKTGVSDVQMVAARVFYQFGNVDLHGFAKYDKQMGMSLGSSFSWVATDALELHTSLRYIDQYRYRLFNPTRVEANAALSVTSPWQDKLGENAFQMLVGVNYTTASHHSFILEAWWDGTARTSSQILEWSKHNQLLQSTAVTQQNEKLLRANLAWQNLFFSNASSLQRRNVFARWYSQGVNWQPAVDLIWTPDDQGRMITASLGWQGENVWVEGGIRWYGGPNRAVVAQLPTSQIAFISSSWSF